MPESTTHAIATEQDPRYQAAEKVANSLVFARAAQLRAILLYIVRRTVEGGGEPIREYDIGYSVLGRKPDFNPVEDNIVRVQMGHLRKKLDAYFAAEGRHESVTIQIPVGSYAPVFVERHVSNVENAAQLHAEHPPESGFAIEGARPLAAATTVETDTFQKSVARIPLWLICNACILTLLAGLFFWFSYKRSKSESSPSVTANPILSELFTTGRPVYVVLADTSLVTLQNAAHSDISISDYIGPRYPENLLDKIPDAAVKETFRTLTRRHYTSLDDADVAARTSGWGTRLGSNTLIRYARLMHVRDFEAGNFIIVGSRRGNPWASLFESRLNFVFREDPSTHVFYFENMKPRSGESQAYRLQPDAGGGMVSYVDIALVPNLARTGTVLLLNGFSMESNEAAMNIIFSDHMPKPIADFAASSISQGAPLEILLRVHGVEGAERGYEIVSMRNGSH